MAKFYTNVFMRGNRMYVRGFDKGLRYTDVVNYTPYLFIPKQGGKYKTLDGRPVEKLDFDSISEARDFSSRYEQVSNMEIYGLTAYTYLYIFDAFKGEIDYDPKILSAPPMKDFLIFKRPISLLLQSLFVVVIEIMFLVVANLTLTIQTHIIFNAKTNMN
jgi:hypothetical protein